MGFVFFALMVFLSILFLLDWICLHSQSRRERLTLERLLQELSLFQGFNKEQPCIFLQTTGLRVFFFLFSSLDRLRNAGSCWWDFATLTCTLTTTFCSICLYFLLQTPLTRQIEWLHYVCGWWSPIWSISCFMGIPQLEPWLFFLCNRLGSSLNLEPCM